MKNFIILAGLTFFALLLAGLEYLFDSPMEVHWSEVIGGVLVLLIGLVCCRRMNAKPKKNADGGNQRNCVDCNG